MLESIITAAMFFTQPATNAPRATDEHLPECSLTEQNINDETCSAEQELLILEDIFAEAIEDPDLRGVLLAYWACRHSVMKYCDDNVAPWPSAKYFECTKNLTALYCGFHWIPGPSAPFEF